MPPATEYAQRLGESIGRLLGLYLLTQAELGKEVGVSPQTMTNIVRGQVEDPRVDLPGDLQLLGLDRFIDDFEAALPDVVARFGEVEQRAAAIRARG